MSMDTLLPKIEALREMRAEITALQSQIKRLDKLVPEAERLAIGILKDVKSMDVTEPGNMGWESRFLAFLLDITKAT